MIFFFLLFLLLFPFLNSNLEQIDRPGASSYAVFIFFRFDNIFVFRVRGTRDFQIPLKYCNAQSLDGVSAATMSLTILSSSTLLLNLTFCFLYLDQGNGIFLIPIFKFTRGNIAQRKKTRVTLRLKEIQSINFLNKITTLTNLRSSIQVALCARTFGHRVQKSFFQFYDRFTGLVGRPTICIHPC